MKGSVCAEPSAVAVRDMCPVGHGGSRQCAAEATGRDVVRTRRAAEAACREVFVVRHIMEGEAKNMR
jgi:hypothetical protein